MTHLYLCVTMDQAVSARYVQIYQRIDIELFKESPREIRDQEGSGLLCKEGKARDNS